MSRLRHPDNLVIFLLLNEIFLGSTYPTRTLLESENEITGEEDANHGSYRVS